MQDKTLTTEKSRDEYSLSVEAELTTVSTILEKIIAKIGIPKNLYIVEESFSDHAFSNYMFNYTEGCTIGKEFNTSQEMKDLYAQNKRPEITQVKKQEQERLASLDRIQLLEHLGKNEVFNQTIAL